MNIVIEVIGVHSAWDTNAQNRAKTKPATGDSELAGSALSQFVSLITDANCHCGQATGGSCHSRHCPLAL